MSIETILNTLNGVKRKSQGRYVALCPVHNEKTPSLAITDAGDGKVLLHCFGCGAGAIEIISALGIEISEIFPERDRFDCAKSARVKPVFTSQQLLTAIHYEAIVVMIVASDILNGKKADFERLATAYKRIEAAVYYENRCR